MKRIHQIVRVKPEHLKTYTKLHKNVWESVLQTQDACHIQNYSIAYRDGLLFAYFEYTGTDYEADMRRMAADPATQEWWAICKPCLTPVESETVSDCWADMEEVFYKA